MNNDRGLLSGSITILIGAVIAIMALVRGPWQIWLLLGVFTLWGLWVVLILLLPYMQQAQRRRQRQQRTRQLHAEGIQTRSFEIPDLGGTPTIVFWHICAPLIRKPPSSGVKSSRSS